MLFVVASIAFALLSGLPAMAGQLFPPVNAAQCGVGTHLVWDDTADAVVRCERDPMPPCNNGLVKIQNGQYRCVAVDIITVQDTRDVSCVLDASGNCHTQKHAIDCPADYSLVSGSCTVGGWHTTKTWDHPNGNGWICAYAEYGLTAYAGTVAPISSTVYATCLAIK